MGMGSRYRYRYHGPELAPRLEEGSQQRGAFVAAHPAEHVDAMAQLRFARQIDDAAAGAGLLIPGAEHHPRYSRVQYGTDAHRAGLESHIQRGPAEPVIAQALRAG